MKVINKIYNYFVILPSITLITTLGLYPIFKLIELSLSDVKFALGEVTTTYVGFRNYIRVLNDPTFHKSCWITFIFSITSTIIEMVIGTLLAIAVANIKNKRIRSITQLILLLTIMVPPVCVALFWRFLLFPTGLVNQIMKSIGLPIINWLGDPFWATISIIIVDVWHWTGFIFLIVYAGYISLPSEIFEVASIDGAKGFSMFRYITLPLLVPTLSIAFLFRITDVLRAFGEIYQLTFGGPREATTILNILIYKMTFDYMDWSYAAVLSIFLIVISLFIMIISIKIGQKGK